ncbi:unnamed protein product [Cunninghamella blakesleeana]
MIYLTVLNGNLTYTTSSNSDSLCKNDGKLIYHVKSNLALQAEASTPVITPNNIAIGLDNSDFRITAADRFRVQFADNTESQIWTIEKVNE